MLKSPHPALDLSFMRMRTRKEGGGIDYWNVFSTGTYGSDCEHGKALAKEYLDYIGSHLTAGNEALLTAIVEAMAGHPAKGIKHGFLCVVNTYAMASAAILNADTDMPEIRLVGSNRMEA